ADFDFVVEERKLRAVVTELEKVFGELDREDVGAAIRLRAIDVDLIRSTDHPLFKAAIEHTRAVGDWVVPVTEVILVLKFLAAVNPWRGSDRRAQDFVDLRSVYRAVGRDALDVALMNELAALVYPTAEKEFGELLGR